MLNSLLRNCRTCREKIITMRQKILELFSFFEGHVRDNFNNIFNFMQPGFLALQALAVLVWCGGQNRQCLKSQEPWLILHVPFADALWARPTQRGQVVVSKGNTSLFQPRIFNFTQPRFLALQALAVLVLGSGQNRQCLKSQEPWLILRVPFC